MGRERVRKREIEGSIIESLSLPLCAVVRVMPSEHTAVQDSYKNAPPPGYVDLVHDAPHTLQE